MGFIAASFLWGLAAVGIPVLLHMTGRSRPTAHRFPAMRFIMLSQRASSRALKIKHLLILLLRMFLLALITLILARPLLGSISGLALLLASGLSLLGLAIFSFYHREFLVGALALFGLLALQQAYPQTSALSERLHGNYVLVLDRSMSMACAELSGSRFESARQQALAIVEHLSPEARVALVFAADTPERPQARLTFRHDLVKQLLLAVQPSAGGAQLSAALSVAKEIALRDVPTGTPPATVVLFTDLQQTTLNTLSIDAERPQAEDSLPLIVVDVSDPTNTVENGAALSLSLPGRIVSSDSTVTVAAKIQPMNARHRSLVELFLDERRVEQKYVEPTGKNILETSFVINTGIPGPHALRLHLAEPDSLSLDQDSYLSFVSGRPARALIVDGPAGARRTSFFLKAALQPTKNSDKDTESDALSISGLEYDVLPLQQFNPSTLNGYKVLILADCGDLADSDWDAIERWTDEGGGLFVWAGPNTSPAGLARRAFQEFSRNKGLLPATVGDIFTPEKPLALVATQPEHPLLAHFSPGVMSVLRETQIRKLLKLSTDTRDTSSTVVLSSGEGHPLLTEKSYGRGRVILSALDPGLEFSDLPRRAEAFVTLSINALRLLAEQSAELKAKLGAPLVVPILNPPLDRQVLWTPPIGNGAVSPLILRCDVLNNSEKNGAPAPSSSQPNKTEQRAQAGVATVILPPIDKPGIHRISWLPQGGKQTVTRLFEVNVDTRESDLTRASNESIHKIFDPWHAPVVNNVFDAPGLNASGQSAGMREFSTLLMILLLALLLLETFLSNRMCRAMETADEKSVEETQATPTPPLPEGQS